MLYCYKISESETVHSVTQVHFHTRIAADRARRDRAESTAPFVTSAAGAGAQGAHGMYRNRAAIAQQLCTTFAIAFVVHDLPQ